MSHHKITPLVIGGTDESYEGDVRSAVPSTSMLFGVTAHLNPEYFNPAWWVGYPADYGTPMSYADSVALAVAKVWDRVVEEVLLGHHVILIGYSQGASVARRVMEKMTAGILYATGSDGQKVLGCANVADPLRPVGICLNRDPGGYGVEGIAGWKQDSWMFQVAATNDIICAAAKGSFVRNLADFSPFFSMQPDGRWMQDLEKKVLSRGWQNANRDWGKFWEIGQIVDSDIRGIKGYLPKHVRYNPGGGRHTCYRTEKAPGLTVPYTQLLANALNQKAADTL